MSSNSLPEDKDVLNPQRYGERFKFARMLRIYDVPASIIKRVLNLPYPEMIMTWENKFGWDKERYEFQQKYSKQIIAAENRTLAEIREDQRNIYQLMQRRALDALNDDDVKAQSLAEAARVADMGIRGERELMSFKIAEELVSNLLTALRDEIKDPEVLKRIGNRLKSVAMGGVGLKSGDQKIIAEASHGPTDSNE
jgi:hypothetical protein